MMRRLVTAANSSSTTTTTNSMQQLPASDCARPRRNTLTTQCFSACSQRAPLCVNYAARPANEALKEGDGDYYYQGCAYTNMPTCKSGVGAAQCELQCLQTKNQVNSEWVLDVSQAQADRIETSLFVHVDKLALPSSLMYLKLVGTTELSRKVPVELDPHAFTSGAALQKISLVDLGIGNVTINIFPTSLTTLIMQRTRLTVFEPAGSHTLQNLRVLDLSENFLTSIPSSVYSFPALSELHLQANNISNVHVSSSQLSFLRSLDVLDAQIDVTGDCQAGYTLYTWDGKSVCYGDGNARDDNMNGAIPQSDDQFSSKTATKTATTGIILSAIAAFIVLAILAGVFLLKRAKKRKNEARKSLIVEEPSGSAKQKFTALKTHRPNELVNPLQDMAMIRSPSQQNSRKLGSHEIPLSDVRVLDVVTQTSAVTVFLGEYKKRAVLVNRLHVSEDSGENCETALSVAPTVAQLRHPQLLTVLGFMWEDAHTLSAVCEPMDRGTLEDFLLASSISLTWRNFKLKAALEIAGCLMYLHGQSHKLTYDGLSGRTVFVDSSKGCKLSTMIACLPNGMVKSHRAKSTRGFCAPEVMAGEAPVAASDMYAFGVLLAQLDTCETADHMIRSSLRQRSQRDLNAAALAESNLSNSSTASSAQEVQAGATTSGGRGSQRGSNTSSNSNTSLMSMFAFTNECPEIVKELAHSCLQFDPSLRPSAQYVAAMLQHLL